MEFFSKNLKVILAVVIVIGIGFVAYSFLTKDQAEDSSNGLSSETNVQSEVGKKIFATLALINTLKLDRTILGSPVFASLRDLTTEIAPEPVGRDNPFLPVRSPAPVNPPARR